MKSIPITKIKGISEARAKVLSKLGVETAGDMLQLYPRSYEDRTKVLPVAALAPDVTATIKVKVINIAPIARIRRNLSIAKILVQDETGTVTLTFYNQIYVRSQFKPGHEYYVYGTATPGYRGLEIPSPAFAEAGTEDFTGMIPIYPLTAGISQNIMRKLMKETIRTCADEINDNLPESVRKQFNIMNLKDAVLNVHFPEDPGKSGQARRSLVFRELLKLSVLLETMKKDRCSEQSAGISFAKTDLTDRLIEALPFELSDGQKKVWSEIQADMESNHIMNRLVMGDVGSGKTIVAVLSMVKAIASGYQTAYMAPTEILAEQHYNNISKLLAPLGIRVGLLTGSLKQSEKADMLSRLSSGDIQCIIGTHALIQDGVSYKNLGLVITDEQHRFGVRQRGKLASGGKNCDVLVMTATPIPRTLALILYGDLDISTINSLPRGRLPIKTYAVDESFRDRVYTRAAKLVKEGQQAYIVHPLIEDSDKATDTAQLLSVERNFVEASRKYFKDISVGIIHGKMKPAEKEEVMRDFASGKISVLFATTVIEVGVDVANATLMIVENAERFGLAQLHQLRGRVGRGKLQSHCVLFNQGQGEVAKERMDIMVKSTDGFEISQKDLDLRGPGEFFGTMQHGLPAFKIANLYEDTAILQEALSASKNMLSSDDSMCRKYISEMTEGNLTL